MKKGTTDPSTLDGSRAIAEERFRDARVEAMSPAAAVTDVQRLVQELQVHQIELEMQNEELRLTERELNESRLLYEDLFESAPVGYFTLDRLGTVLRANLTGASLLGVPRSRLFGTRLGIYLAGSNRLAFAGFLADVMAGKPAGPCTATLTRENGDQVFVHLVGTADPAGSSCKVVMTDVTKLTMTEEKLRQSETEVHKLESDLGRQIVEKTTQQGAADVARDAATEQLLHLWKARAVQLEASNRELDAFSYSVAHDLRAPVRAIDGFAKLLEDHTAGSLDEEGRRLLAIVRKNSLRMGHLIDDLLTYARAARNDILIGDIDMARLVSEILPEVLPEERRSQFEVRVVELLPALGDRDLVRQVLLNLLQNAVKFTGPKANPVIEVGSRRVEVVVEYFVRDNGVGFDQRYVGKLFGVFQRLHSEKEFPGTGIGLSLVRRIVERHGGKVRAEGVVGEGATFYFTLPVTT